MWHLLSWQLSDIIKKILLFLFAQNSSILENEEDGEIIKMRLSFSVPANTLCLGKDTIVSEWQGVKAETTAVPPLRLGQSPSSQAHSSENTNTKRSFTLTVITRGKARRSAALQIHFLTPLELSILGQNGLQFTLYLELLIYSFT